MGTLCSPEGTRACSREGYGTTTLPCDDAANGLLATPGRARVLVLAGLGPAAVQGPRACVSRLRAHALSRAREAGLLSACLRPAPNCDFSARVSRRL